MIHRNTGRTARLKYSATDGTLTVHIDGLEPEVFTDIDTDDAAVLSKAAVGDFDPKPTKRARRK
jgi:hypothetical protein